MTMLPVDPASGFAGRLCGIAAIPGMRFPCIHFLDSALAARVLAR